MSFDFQEERHHPVVKNKQIETLMIKRRRRLKFQSPISSPKTVVYFMHLKINEEDINTLYEVESIVPSGKNMTRDPSTMLERKVNASDHGFILHIFGNFLQSEKSIEFSIEAHNWVERQKFKMILKDRKFFKHEGTPYKMMLVTKTMLKRYLDDLQQEFNNNVTLGKYFPNPMTVEVKIVDKYGINVKFFQFGEKPFDMQMLETQVDVEEKPTRFITSGYAFPVRALISRPVLQSGMRGHFGISLKNVSDKHLLSFLSKEVTIASDMTSIPLGYFTKKMELWEVFRSETPPTIESKTHPRKITRVVISLVTKLRLDRLLLDEMRNVTKTAPQLNLDGVMNVAFNRVKNSDYLKSESMGVRLSFGQRNPIHLCNLALLRYNLVMFYEDLSFVYPMQNITELISQRVHDFVLLLKQRMKNHHVKFPFLDLAPDDEEVWRRLYNKKWFDLAKAALLGFNYSNIVWKSGKKESRDIRRMYRNNYEKNIPPIVVGPSPGGGGMGAFWAGKRVVGKQKLSLVYAGELVENCKPGSDYCVEVEKKIVDAYGVGNKSRFLNYSRNAQYKFGSDHTHNTINLIKKETIVLRFGDQMFASYGPEFVKRMLKGTGELPRKYGK